MSTCLSTVYLEFTPVMLPLASFIRNLLIDWKITILKGPISVQQRTQFYFVILSIQPCAECTVGEHSTQHKTV